MVEMEMKESRDRKEKWDYHIMDQKEIRGFLERRVNLEELWNRLGLTELQQLLVPKENKGILAALETLVFKDILE